ncbi:zeta toxin family protein [Streptomyces milbemycinicus]|uniref:zeta toxin family protein n=1 Tax=Streptomyces milbemycinicus TaxID=476552 RepID=UPI0033FD1AE3
MVEASDYYLTDKELRDRFEDEKRGVRKFVFSRYTPQDNPVLILLGGQPAAGKSQAMAAAQQRHAERQLVPLTGDELRPFHPRYQELLDTQPQLFPSATGQASGAWVRMSIEHALANGYSLMLEGIFRDPAMTVGTAERFARAGFTVEVVGLAVRPERSRLDSLHRYLAPGTGLPGRWTPPHVHDLAIRVMPETIAAAEASPAVERITITDRSAADLYINQRTAEGVWAKEPTAAQALNNVRDRPLPTDEAASWLSRYRDIIITFAARGEVNDSSRAVLQQVATDADTIAEMVDGDPTSPPRVAHESAQALLRTLVSAPLPGPTMPLPLRLLTDDGLAEHRARLEQATEAVAHKNPAQDSQREAANEVVKKLEAQGAPQEVMQRAQASVREDRQYAQSQSVALEKRIARLRQGAQDAAAEIQRRSGLSGEQRRAEQAVQAQLHAARRPQQQPSAPSAAALRIRGTQRPPWQRRQSL